MEHSIEVQKYCAGEYLHSVKRLTSKVRALISEHTFVLSQLTGAAISYQEAVQSSTSGDKLPNGVIKLMELAEELDTERVELAEQLRVAKRVLDGISNERAAYALQLHYIEGKEWHDVAKAMRYSERNIFKLREEALPEVYALMPEEYRRYTIPNAEVH